MATGIVEKVMNCLFSSSQTRESQLLELDPVELPPYFSPLDLVATAYVRVVVNPKSYTFVENIRRGCSVPVFTAHYLMNSEFGSPFLLCPSDFNPNWEDWILPREYTPISTQNRGEERRVFVFVEPSFHKRNIYKLETPFAETTVALPRSLGTKNKVELQYLRLCSGCAKKMETRFPENIF